MTRLTLILTAVGVCLASQQAAAQQAAPQEPAAKQQQPAAAASDSLTARTIYREAFDYGAGGRRDPFASLLGTGEIKPLYEDLRLTSVIFDPSGTNSVAVLRDATSREQYRVRTGQTIGRLRVVAIRQRSVTFAIEEFGYSRQETLNMGDPDRSMQGEPERVTLTDTDNSRGGTP